MGPVNGMNPATVDYFPLVEYARKIRLDDNVLFHLEETNRNFDEYLRHLAQYDDYTVLHHWISSLFNEIAFSQRIENHLIKPEDMLRESIFFDTLQMSHARIKRLHQFVLDKDDKSIPDDYREKGEEVRVSAMNPDNGEEILYWKGAQGADVKKFMDDFIALYKSNSLSLLNSNPFLKSALVSLLFVRIHPFKDGNGRTSRMIYNIKFTDLINKIYNTKLKLCPLNLSRVIMMYRPTYAKTINNIYFDMEHDNNEEINAWFEFILRRADEEIFYGTNQIPQLDRNMEQAATAKAYDEEACNVDGNIVSEASKMKLKKLR